MIFKNANDQAERIRESLDHLDDVRMPKEAREHLKGLRNAVALLVVHTVRETLQHEPLEFDDEGRTVDLGSETTRLAARVIGDAKPPQALRVLLQGE
jgi:hypothetical protein